MVHTRRKLQLCLVHEHLFHIRNCSLDFSGGQRAAQG
jgi:hypothetical protein